MKSKFSASISTLGIADKKTQQALMRLLENTTYLNDRLTSEVRSLKSELERQKAYFENKITNRGA